jgi:hypothetical protein
MKKLIVLIAALLAAMLIVGCVSTPSGPSASEMMASAKNNAPSGTLIGQAIGTAGKDRDAAIKKAEQNAVLQIVRGLQYLVGDMIDEQSASGKVSAAVAPEFKQKVNLGLTRVSLVEVVKVESGAAGDTGYAVYSLNKTEAQKVLVKVVNAAKEEVAAGNFDFNNYDASFNKAAAREWK